MTELPRNKTASRSDTRKIAARQGPHDAEVYGTLGALLGTLEVIATDDRQPLAISQLERMRGAMRLGSALQAQVEALLTLADDDLAERLQLKSTELRPLVEHAVRGALRSFERAEVTLVLPAGEWGGQSVRVDASRLDRSLRALAETVAARVGTGGRLHVSIGQRGAQVELALHGRPGAGGDVGAGGLVVRGARRLLELQGGALESEALSFVLLLPASEVP